MGRLITGFFQVCYVTREFDRAADHLAAHFGVRETRVMRDLQHNEDTQTHMLLGWVDEVMIELVEARGPGTSVWDTLAPAPGQLMRLHHHGHLLESDADWEAMKASAAAAGMAIPLEREREGFHYAFVDARDSVGHYMEYIRASPFALDMLRSVPANSGGRPRPLAAPRP